MDKQYLALAKKGIFILPPKEIYSGFTKSIIIGHNWFNWPKIEEDYRLVPPTNSYEVEFMERYTGLSIWTDGPSLSVSLSHPMADYYLSILQPIWDEQNKGKCQTCNGSGWDGIGYILNCCDCNGTGKLANVSKL